MAEYVSYYDCSNWISEVEVMNIQDETVDYRITLYDRDGSEAWSDIRTLTPHQTERIRLNSHARNKKEGLVVVEPVQAKENEFPSLLVICDEGRDWRKGNRFVPFIRIP
jgi:hypothetical protein